MAVLAGSVALALGGCGGAHSTGRLRSQTPSTTAASTGSPTLPVAKEAWTDLPAPPSAGTTGPASGQQDLAFTSEGTGFLVTSGPFGESHGQIQRTTDDGTTWTTVWQKAGASLYWVGTLGSEVLASGSFAPPGTDANQATPLLLRSDDGGASWTSLTPSVPPPPSGHSTSYLGLYWTGFRLVFTSQKVGLAVTDSKLGEATLEHRLLRSTDGGAHWADVSLPGGTPSGGLTFTDPLRGYATGSTRAPGCQSQIWATSDGGANWQAIPGTCVAYLLDAVSFPTATEGFVAGGNYSKYGLAPQRAVMATSDAGGHWAQVYAQGGNSTGTGYPADGPFAELSFVDPSHAYALVGGCTMGANGPCGGDLWSTSDGGHSWTASNQRSLRLALNGSRDVWLVAGGLGGGGEVMWHSTDGAASWTPVADPAYVGISGLVASSDTIWISTDAGQFISYDGARSWAPLPAAVRSVEVHTGASVIVLGPSGLLVVGGPGSSQLWISNDGGRTGRAVLVSGFGRYGQTGVGFSDDQHGLALGVGSQCAKAAGPPGQGTPPFQPSPAAVLATDDGGGSWHQVGQLQMSTGALGDGATVAVVVGSGPGPTPPCPPEVATSTDGGASWKTWSMPPGYHCGAPSAAGDTTLLVCPDYSSGTQETTLLVSRDAGQAWTADRVIGTQQATNVVAAGSGQLWATGPPGVLWHSTDGGAHWSAMTPALPVAS